MEPGLYLTFFTEGESFENELPPVGPLEHVIVRDMSLLADRRDGHHADHFEGGPRAIEAEYEFQRALGKEAGGLRRPDLRVVAPQGVYLRFVSFGSAAEHDPVPELGPYAVVVVGRRAVEADGDRLASRIGTKQNLWELTAAGGSALVGVIRPDIAFRTRSTVYHPELKPFRPAKHAAAKPVPIPTPQPPAVAKPSALKPAPASPPQVHLLAASPTKTAVAAPPAGSRVVEAPPITLLDRIRAEEPARPSVVSTGSEGRDFGSAAWRLRLAIIATLVILIAAFSVPSVRALFSSGTPGAVISTVSITTSVASADWNYSVGSVRRVSSIGSAKARGTYLVVQVAATNRKGAGAQLFPSGFSLAVATGEEFAASAATSIVYSSDANLGSSYAWPTEFPVGRSVVVPIIFDVTPSVSGTELVIRDVPSTRVRLE